MYLLGTALGTGDALTGDFWSQPTRSLLHLVDTLERADNDYSCDKCSDSHQHGAERAKCGDGRERFLEGDDC